METTMNKIITLLTLSILSFGISASAVAIYTCDLEEGKTLDEVKAANSKWVKAVNELSESAVSSYVLEPIVSSNMEGFTFIDTYTDEVTWATVNREIRSGALSELSDLFEGLSECPSVTLHNSEES
jgi:hypothetical protein